MTPAMHLSAIKMKYANDANAEIIRNDLEEAFALGWAYGLECAAAVVDQSNREGPYQAIGSAKRIRALKLRSEAFVEGDDEVPNPERDF